MSDADGLLAAILARPDDDTPRLVYADWLEERGGYYDAARADLIRAQCELARSPGSRGADGRVTAAWHRLGPDGRRVEVGADLHCRADHGVPDGLRVTTCAAWERGFVAEVRLPLAALFGGECGRCGGGGGVDTGRDFLPGVPISEDCPGCAGAGLTGGCAVALFGLQPVTAVGATDKRPLPWTYDPQDGRCSWWRGLFGEDDWSDLPDEVFDRLAGGELTANGYQRFYQCAEDAQSDLSHAAVALGRDLAGLGPMPA